MVIISDNSHKGIQNLPATPHSLDEMQDGTTYMHCRTAKAEINNVCTSTYSYRIST